MRLQSNQSLYLKMCIVILKYHLVQSRNYELFYEIFCKYFIVDLQYVQGSKKKLSKCEVMVTIRYFCNGETPKHFCGKN